MEAERMKQLERYAIRVDNKSQERAIASWCKAKHLKKVSSYDMDKTQTYYYIIQDTGQLLTLIPIQKDEDYLIDRKIINVPFKKFKEIYEES